MNRLLDRPVPVAPSWPETAQNGAERQLLDALERIGRGAPRPGTALLVLHLSRMPPPGPLPFHRRNTAALLDGAGEGGNGGLFVLSNGDLALLFRAADNGTTVLALLGELFGAVPFSTWSGPARSLWPLPAAAGEALAFVRNLAAAATGRSGAEATVPAAAPAPPPRREVAVRLSPGSAEPIRPLFRELVPDGERTTEAAAIAAARLRLESPPPPGGAELPLHLNLSVVGVMSDSFARLLDAAAIRGGASLLAAEVTVAAVAAEPNGLVLARERLRLAGAGFVLDGVTIELLPLVRPAALEPRFIKLAWAPSLSAAAEAEVANHLRRLGTERLVLTGCDAEEAVRWGRARGIERFQGPFIESALAAARLRRCGDEPRSGRTPCSLAECRDRAATLTSPVPPGCHDPALLEAGLGPRAR